MQKNMLLAQKSRKKGNLLQVKAVDLRVVAAPLLELLVALLVANKRTSTNEWFIFFLPAKCVTD